MRSKICETGDYPDVRLRGHDKIIGDFDNVPEAWAFRRAFALFTGFAATLPKNDPAFATVLNPFATTLDGF
jgi:hypothetical protein